MPVLDASLCLFGVVGRAIVHSAKAVDAGVVLDAVRVRS